METIRNYLEMLFQRLPNTQEVSKAKFELGQMMEDKYNELLAEGVPENEAVGKVIAEFGNLDELAESLGIQSYLNTENSAASRQKDEQAPVPPFTPTAERASSKKKNVDYKNPTVRTVMSVFWPTVTCLYLSWSFLSFDWHVTWILWPLAAIVRAILNAVFDKEV